MSVREVLTVFTGYAGTDRIYEGAYASGILKLVLFLTFFLITPTSLELLNLKHFLGVLVFLWYLLDLFRMPMTDSLVNVIGVWVALNIVLYYYQY